MRASSLLRLVVTGGLAVLPAACGGSSPPLTPPMGPQLTLRRAYAVEQLDPGAGTLSVAAIGGCDRGTLSYALQADRLTLTETPADAQPRSATFVGNPGALAGEWLADPVSVCPEPWTFCLPKLLLPRSGGLDAIALRVTLSADAMLLDFHDARPALNQVMLQPLVDALPAYITSFRYYWAEAFRGWAQSPVDPAMQAAITGVLDGSLLTLTFAYAGYTCVLTSDLSARVYEDFPCSGPSGALTPAQLELRTCVEQSGFMKP